MTDPLDWARIETRTRPEAGTIARLGRWERLHREQGHDVRGRVEANALVLEAFPGSAVATLPTTGVRARAIDSFVDHPGLTEQIAAAFGFSSRPWRSASTRDALAVPAIHRAVTLISNTTGMLTFEEYQLGSRVPALDIPAVVRRPNPTCIPRDFHRDTVYSMAVYGEAWWYVAHRDSDGYADAVLVVPAREVHVERTRDLLRPAITWGNRSTANGTLDRADMKQITLMKEPGELRGYGPLQVCGAAVSVAVESMEWAANFYAAGGYPNIWIKAAGDLSGAGDPEAGAEADDPDPDGYDSEVRRLKDQWINTEPNTPRITDEGIIDIKQFDPNPQGAQMLDARAANNGDAARMFGIPGSLLDHQESGSSLTYQNLEQEMTKFLRTCLIPNYLEPVEQTFSDLRPRTRVVRYSVDEVNRADRKTRFETYQIGIEAGFLDVEMVQREEGLVPGSVETAPVPFAPSAALAAALPYAYAAAREGSVARVATGDVRCSGMRTRRRSGTAYIARCDRLLSTTGVFVGTCPRCKTVYGPSTSAVA